MGFVQPWMLLFGLVAFVPLVLHLIGRQRARVVHFSALAFLLASDPKRARALRIEQRLLVALRMAVAAVIALSLAQPLLPSWDDEDALVLGSGPVAVVLVVDNSLSMGVRREGRSRLQRAQRRAVKLLEALPTGSRAAIVTSARPAIARHVRLSPDLRSVIADVGRIGASTRPDDAARAMRLARRLLAGTPAGDRRLVVLSDLQGGNAGHGGWEGVNLRQPGLRVVQVGTAANDVVLTDAVVEPGLARGPQHARVRVSVQRHAPEDTNPEVWRGQLRLRVGERETISQVKLSPGKPYHHTFEVPALADLAEVSVAAANVAGGPADALATDRLMTNNARWLRIGGGQTLRVLLLNGAPRPIARQDEVFFLVQALRAGLQRSDELRVEVRRPDQLLADALPNWDVLVLANVSELSGAQLKTIQRHVEAGAGVLVTMGDQVPTETSRWLTGLLPVTLAGVDSGRGHQLQAAKGGGGLPLQRLRARLRDGAIQALAGGRVRKRRLLRPDAQVAAWTALRFDDGAPAFVVAPRGKGRVALWMTSIDRDWTDVPMHPGWLPLARQLVLATAGQTGGIERLDVEVGQSVLVARAAGATALEVRHGDRLVQTLQARAQPAGLWRIPDLATPGLWSLQTIGPAAAARRVLIVRPPNSESEPKLLRPPTPAPVADSGSSESRPAQRPLVPAWSFAFIGLFFLLIAEAGILRRSA